MSIPVAYDLQFVQGDTYYPTLTLYWPGGAIFDLTDWSAALTVTPNFSNPDVLLSLTSGNGGLILGGSAGTLQFNLTAAQSQALPIGAPTTTLNGVPVYPLGTYQLTLTSPQGNVTTATVGHVWVTPSVT